MEKPIRGSAPQPDHIMISFNGDTKTQMAVTWRTSTDVQTGYVLAHKENSNEILRFDSIDEEFVSDIDESIIHSSLLTGLTPGAKYYYTCGNDEYRSDEYNFKTQAENVTSFKFICVSDQQKSFPFDCPDYSQFQNYVKKILKENPDTAFILTGGDNTDCGQHEVQWNGAFSGLTGIAEYIPFMMTVGNHDNRGYKDYKNGIGRYYAEPAEYFCKQFKNSYAYNGPKNWKTENYYFDYGNARFCVMGVNGPEEVNDWAVDILNCDKAWKIGTYHFPICYSGLDCQNYDAYPMMQQAFESLDIAFSGHEHNFSRSFPLKNENLYDKPSEGTVHYMLGNSGGNPPGSRTLSKVWHAAFFTQEVKEAMIAIVEVDGNKMKLTSVLEDGRIVDECIIDKDNDVIYPRAVAPQYDRTRMMFKGADPGLCCHDLTCIVENGLMYACLPALIGYIGGDVKKEKGKVTLSIYGHTAEFFEGSDKVISDGKEVLLPGKVIRANLDQLYMPCDACHLFDMRWAYADKNNFVSFEHESESKPVTIQP